MEKYNITYGDELKNYEFIVGQYPFGSGETCKYRVFFNGKVVASLHPDRHNHLHICNKVKSLDEALISLLADEIEDRHPNVISWAED